MTLEGALLSTLKAALSSASDQFIRVDLPPDWPIVSAISEIASDENFSNVRVGLLRPFTRISTLELGGLKSSNDPSEITAWRNEQNRTDAVVVLGRPSGEKTAGLKDLAVVLETSDVVTEWQRQVEVNWDPLPDKLQLRKLVESLFERLSIRSLDASGLDSYLDELRIGGDENLQQVFGEMWRLGLIPDRQAIDAGRVSTRLDINADVVQKLSSLDDDGYIEKLRKVAASGGKNASVAIMALSYSETGEARELRDIWLEDLLKILGKKKKTRKRSERSGVYGLHDLLDFASKNKELVESCLSDLAEKWILDNPDLEQIQTLLEINEETIQIQIDLAPDVIPIQSGGDESEHSSQFVHIWTEDIGDDDPLIASSPLAEPKAFFNSDQAAKFRKVAHLESSIKRLGDSSLIGAFKDFVEKRHALRLFEPWLKNNATDLLIIHSQSRDAVGAYLTSWCSFVDRIISTQTSVSKFVQMMDACWGPDLNEPSWCVLGSLHPYNLDPIFSTAKLVEAGLSAESPGENLGEKYSWILERCHPAYPNIYSGESTFHFAASGDELIYLITSSTQLPRAQTGTGIHTTIRSLCGFSPNLKSGMTVCVIDPPPGAAVTSQLKKIANEYPLSVLMAATRSDANPLDDEDLNVKFLGRFDSLSEIETQAKVRSNLAIVFLPYPSAAAAARQGWSATRGTFLTPLLRVHQDPLLDDENSLVADVLVQPRDHNSVVRTTQKLYEKETGNLAKHFQFQPVLKHDDEKALRNLSTKCDWLIVAVPGPMGLAAPARINSQLHYVGRSTLGPYALYTYACDELFATRKYIEKKLKDSPAQVPVESLTNKLTELAKDSAAAILAMGRSDVQVREHQAALVALKAAQESVDQNALNIPVSVDDVAWSEIWIGGKGERCDYLVVSLISNRDDALSCTITAVESKSIKDSEPIVPSPTKQPFKKGIKQVTSTLDALAVVVSPESQTNLDQDVRFASFVEHLMASVLSSSNSSDIDKIQKNAALLNKLAERKYNPKSVKYHGVVVVTQVNTNAEPTITMHSTSGATDSIKLIRCTARNVDALFETSYSDQTSTSGSEEVVITDDVEEEVAQSPPEKTVIQPTSIDDVESVSSDDNITTEQISEDVDSKEESGYELDEESESIAHELLVVCQRHSIPVESLKPLRISVGPTLFAVSVKLQVGAQLSLIERRLEDIMRDLGLGDRAHEVSVENDSQPSAVKFLIPRPQRVYPSLPKHSKSIVSGGSYLPLALGQEINGDDFYTAVEDWPHMLVAGSSGSGKTTLLKSLLLQLAELPTGAFDLILIDGKGDADYLHILPDQLFSDEFPEPLLGHESALEVLRWVIEEMNTRRDQLHEYAAKSNSQIALKWPDIYKSEIQAGQTPTVKPLIVLIDEFADIMLADKKTADEFLDLVQRVAQVGRSRLIHLLLATQRPDRQTIKGAIKSNLDARVAMRLPTAADSITILGTGGAEKLLKWGDFWFQSGSRTVRLQGYSC